MLSRPRLDGLQARMSTPRRADALRAGIHTFYGPIDALKGVDIDVAEGEIVTMIGANGAGKSTLLMTICGTPRAPPRPVMFEGEDITRKPTLEIMRMGIAQSPEGGASFRACR